MSDMQVALELKAEVGRFTSALQQASGEFNTALQGMQGTAAQTGDRVEQAMQKVGLRRHSEINAEIRSVERAYQTLAQSGTLSQRELAQASLAMQDRIRQLRSETNGWTQSLSAMKTELAVAGAAVFAVTRTFGQAARASSEFQTALREITTLDFDGNIDQLRGEIERLSREFGGDVITNAKAAYDIISAGASDSAQAVELLTQANLLAVGGVTDVSTAADGLTSIIGAYGDAAGGAKNITDALFVAMQGGKTTIGELSGSVGQVSQLARTAGLSLEEMLAASSALTRSAGSTSAAMTQLQGILAAVIRPTAEAQRTAEALGLEFNTAAIRSQGFAAWMEEVTEKTGGSDEVLGKLFGRLEGLNGALSLTGEGAEAFSEILENMSDKAGATEEAVAKMMDTPAMRAARFNEAMAGVQRSLGDAVTALSPLLEGLTTLANRFNELDPTTRTVIAGLGGFTAAAVALLPAVTAIYRAIGILRLGFIAATGATTANTAALGANAAAAGASAGAMRVLAAAMRAVPWLAAIATAAQLTTALLELRSARQRLSEAEAEAERGAERLADRLEEVARATGLNLETMEDFNRAVENGAIVYNEASGQWQRAAQSQRELADAAEDAADALEAQADPLREQMAALLDTASASGELAAALREIDPAADDAAGALDNLIAALDLADRADLNTLRLALGELGSDTGELADLIEDRLLAAVREADGQTLQALLAQIREVRDAGLEAGTALESMASEALAESFRRLGLTMETELGKVSPAAQRAIDSVDGVIEGVRDLGLETQQQSQVIERALTAAFKSADTAAAIAELQERIERAREQGLITAETYERMSAAVQAALADATQGQEVLAEKTGEATQQLAAQSEVLERQSGSLRQHADASHQAAGGQAALSSAVDDATETARASRTVMVSHAAVLERAGFSASEAASASDIYGETLARVRRETGHTVNGLASYVRWLNQSREAALAAADQMRRLDQSLARLESRTGGASQRTADLELRLIELSATEAEAAEARASREREQIELEMRRNSLMAQRAQLAGDEAGAQQYRRENTELRRQLELLDQIARAEAERAKAQKREADPEDSTSSRQRSNDGGTSQSAAQNRTTTIRIEGSGRAATVPMAAEADVLALIEEAMRRAI